MGTSLGTTINLSTGKFFFLYQIDLGQMLIATLLLCILGVMVLRWVFDWMYRE